MKHMKEIAHDLLKTMINKMVEQEGDEWPPNCSMIMYQPERPTTKIQADD